MRFEQSDSQLLLGSRPPARCPFRPHEKAAFNRRATENLVHGAAPANEDRKQQKAGTRRLRLPVPQEQRRHQTPRPPDTSPSRCFLITSAARTCGYRATSKQERIMRLVSYSSPSGPRAAVVNRQRRYVDLNSADPKLPPGMCRFLALGPEGLARAAEIAQTGKTIDPAAVKLLPPVPRPEKILCIGL